MRIVVFVLTLLAWVHPDQTRASGETGQAARPTGKRELRMFYLFSASFDDVKTVAGEFLSPEGTISHMQSKNAAVVIDYPANLQQIAEVIKALEGADPPANIRIEVAFDEVSESTGKGWEVDPGLPVIVEDGKVKNDTVTIGGKHTRRRGSARTSQEILTRAGGEAQIWVGETVKQPMWLYQYGRRRAWWQAEFSEYSFGASLWVRPKLLPTGLVEVEVFPRITTRTNDRLGIDVKELTVKVYARDGQTVTIGGMDQQKRDVYSKIFGRGGIFTGSTLAIKLTPHIERLDPAPAPGNVRKPANPIKIDRKYRKLD